MSAPFDALVIGSGPAGAVASLVLARGGARVALVDKASFPRDKACGDLVGPRGVALLTELGLDGALAAGRRVDDMVVIGPTDRRVRLPCFPGRTYPGHAVALPRIRFDAALRDAAADAGAEIFVGRAAEPIGDDGVRGFTLSTGIELRADVIIGADGATSRVADAAGLVDPQAVLWGFALRGYVDEPVDTPHIVLWEPERWRAFPGYAWLFPGVDGRSNVGLGVGVLADRTAASAPARRLGAFVGHLRDLGLLRGDAVSPTLGGWLKLGMVGTIPAHDRVLLVGDAAGLVNPLQGEGIAPAIHSARAAAEAVLTNPSTAAARYRRALTATPGPFMAATVPAHAALLPRPRAIGALGRALTAPGVGAAVASTWSIFWNDLAEGGARRPARSAAAGVGHAARFVTAGSRSRLRLAATLAGRPAERRSD